LILDGHRIRNRQGLCAVRPGAHAIDGAPACFNPNKVVAQIVELLLDARLARLADGHHADHRSNPDRDAQHGQDAAHLVPEQRHHRGTQQSRAIHEDSSQGIFLAFADK
jgi:hypothetical protein